MPKLPEIRYSTNVQSLGREDINAPGRLAAARTGAARSVFEGVKEVERTFAAAEYTKQMSQARNSINELYDAVVSKEAYTSSEIPEFVTGIDRHETVTLPDGTEIVQERIIPASEVREQWFKQGMQNITNGVIKGTKTPTARTRISNELKTSIGPAAYNQLLQYNRTAVKKEQLAILDASINEGVNNGDRLAVEETLYRFLVSGAISKDDYETRKLAASQDLDIEAYSKEITEAEDAGDLETTWDNMNSGASPTKAGNEPSDMTPEQRRQLRTHINSQRSMFEREEKENILETEREGTVLLNNGKLTTGWINEQLRTGAIERPAAMALMNAMTTGSAGSVKRSNVISTFKGQIMNNLLSPDFGVQISDLARELKKDLNESTYLNGAEKADLYDYIVKFENDLDNNPQFDQARKYISNVTGVPDDLTAREISRQKTRGNFAMQELAYNDFLTGLVMYIDEFGVEADPMEWVTRNSDRYTRLEGGSAISSLGDRVSKAFPELAIPGEKIIDMNPDSIMRKAASMFYQPGNRVSEEKMFDLWSMLYDTAVDTSVWGELP